MLTLKVVTVYPRQYWIWSACNIYRANMLKLSRKEIKMAQNHKFNPNETTIQSKLPLLSSSWHHWHIHQPINQHPNARAQMLVWYTCTVTIQNIPAQCCHVLHDQYRVNYNQIKLFDSRCVHVTIMHKDRA